MADPISVISLVEGSIGLVLQCGSVAKTLSGMIAKFKHAEVAIMSLIQEVETIRFAWSRIKEWSVDHAEAATDSDFVQRVEKSLQCGTLVLSALEQDLANYKSTDDNASFKLRSKMAWNERAFLDHQHRVRGQVQAMTLMLQVSQLSTSKAQNKLLKKKEKAFRASDESAYSIVPSRMSSHMSVSTRSRDSVLTIQSQEPVYYPLSFEDDLFTARVYKRNYRNPWINSLVKLRWGKKTKEGRVPTANPESSGNVQSLLSSSTVTTTPKSLSVDFSRPWPSNRDIPLRDLRPVSPSPALTTEKNADPTDLERSVIIPGSIPSTLEESPSIGPDLQNGTMDPSIKPMYTAEGQPDMSGANSPAPGRIPQIDDESNVAVARPSLAPKAQYEMNRSLPLAVKEGNLDDVKTLIYRRAQVNPQCVDERPPLHLAVCKRDVSMTKLLLQEGANCAQEWCGTLPIHRACQHTHVQILQILLEAGASASALDAQQEQPLHTLVSWRIPRSVASDLIDLLISRGADINARTRTNETPLHLSCKYADVNNIRALLVHGANTNVRDSIGNTPFHSLAMAWSGWRDPADFKATTQLLLLHGVNLNAQNDQGDTPLHTLVKGGLVYETALLIQHGVNVNAQNKAGDTPLHTLVKEGLIYEAVIPLLIRHGVNLNAQNKAGDTPLHILLTIAPTGRPNRTVYLAVFRSLIKCGAQVNI